MKLNVMFTIAAILLIFAGTVALLSFVVPFIKTLEGITDVASAYAFLIIAVAQLVFGVVAWLIRKAPASKTLTTIAYGYGSLFALWAVVDIIGNMGQFSTIPGHDNSLWVWVVIFTLLAVGFFITGNSSNLTSDSSSLKSGR
jgi:hypothetical protein